MLCWLHTHTHFLSHCTQRTQTIIRRKKKVVDDEEIEENDDDVLVVVVAVAVLSGMMMKILLQTKQIGWKRRRQGEKNHLYGICFLLACCSSSSSSSSLFWLYKSRILFFPCRNFTSFIANNFAAHGIVQIDTTRRTTSCMKNKDFLLVTLYLLLSFI